MPVVENYDDLEQELLSLGARELEAEQLILAVKQRCKAAVAAGRLDEADIAWSLYEQTQKALVELQSRIMKVEARLYSARRWKR